MRGRPQSAVIWEPALGPRRSPLSVSAGVAAGFDNRDPSLQMVTCGDAGRVDAGVDALAR
jgi:hypothetical protein